MERTRPVILILGPTAGGKTALAITLAGRLPGGGEIISADSMQVYRGMDIGTAKPAPEQRAAVPHHLLDITDPARDDFSVDAWLRIAGEAIGAIQCRGRHPIIVGGTNLYVQAFLEGLFDGPPPDPALRSRLQAMDPDQLRARLQHVDPPAARRIHPNDVKRTIRAIEVFEQSGKRLSDLQQQWFQGPPRDDVVIIGLEYPVEAINRRINARVKAMIEAGLVGEVRCLLQAGHLGPQAREALGYKQIIEHLQGRCSLEDAVEQVKIRTRRYAKQQRTWLRRFRAHPRAIWIDAAPLSTEELAQQALAAIDAIAAAAGNCPAPAHSPRAHPTDSA